MTGRAEVPRVKVCGLTRRGDVEHASRAGADYVGVILVPETPRHVSPREARALVQGVDALPVVVVADLEVDETVDVAGFVGAGVIQLHGHEPPDLVARLREAGPWAVWKAVRVREPGDANRGLELYRQASDGLLLDGWDPSQRGGTGRRFPWAEVGRWAQDFPPELLFIAAGGLTPANVSEAIRELRPHVVDVSSGVEVSPGIKDREKVETFIRSVRTQERRGGP